MLAKELEDFLHRHIPLSRSMEVSVIDIAAQGVTLRASFAPNINHRNSVFGGSAAALGLLAAWSLLHVRLGDSGIAADLVVRRSTMKYEAPITGDFTACASISEPEAWQTFEATLERRGKARIAVSAILQHEGRIAARFSGEFVARAAEASVRDPSGA